MCETRHVRSHGRETADPRRWDSPLVGLSGGAHKCAEFIQNPEVKHPSPPPLIAQAPAYELEQRGEVLQKLAGTIGCRAVSRY